MNQPSEPLDARPRTMKEICAHYGVSYRTMRKLLQAAGLHDYCLKKGSGMYYFQISEIRQIMAAFAQPELDFK